MKKLNKKGFTLMELIIVIAIIAVLMLILVPTMGGFVGQAKEEANTANAKAVYTAIVAQNTAAKAGLGYDEVEDGNCKDSNLHSDFYDKSDLGNATCTITITSNEYTVTYDTGKYPN
ncbi:MAG: prepilin-type N-terminal cleavage/methylation domain-containing protein [Erysipelotrichales bacterium]|nr:prepilin-type N-terminal cleavage/methylation domain-containing protein [Erysipelotrichales bacterium]